jgi:hypothetical protein
MYRRIKIDLEPVFGGMSVTVSLKTSTGGGFATIIGPVDIIQPTPELLRLGFAASTGSVFAYHEVRDVVVRTAGEVRTLKSANECVSPDNVEIHTYVVNNTTAPVNGIAVSDTLPASFIVVGSPEVASGSTGAFTVTTQPDGRTVYAFSADVSAMNNAHIIYHGRFDAMPPGAQFTSSVHVTPPGGFVDTNTDDNYATFTALFGQLSVARTEILLCDDPVTFAVEATHAARVTAYEWAQSLNNGLDWTPLVATDDSYTHTGNSSFRLIRSVAQWDFGCRDTVVFRALPCPDNVADATCYITPEGVEWGMDSIYSNEHNLSPYQTVLVGDIDDDGIVELIASADPVNTPSSTNDRYASKIAIYKGNDIKAPPLVFETISSYNWDHRIRYGLVRTRIDGRDSVLIVVAERDRYLRAYDNRGQLVWTSNNVYHASLHNGISPTFADFNHDGIPEIALAGSLFNSVNGALICTIPSTVSVINQVETMIVQAVDVFNEGRHNYVIANYIYDVNIDPTTNAIQSLTLNRKINPPAAYSTLEGGRHLFVDIDNDGWLDLVVAKARSNPAEVLLYVADPVTNTIKAHVVIANVNQSGYPFVGDVDGDGRNEITLITGNNTTNNFIHCYKYVDGNATLQLFWSLPHTDTSNCTGLTLFDFDQDGLAELVYRDEKHLRILDGRASNATNPVLPPDRNKAMIPNISGTSGEYPVIADVDGDGQAEIVIVGGRTGDPSSTLLGRLWIFKSSNPATSPWAPARKVWNQEAYHPLYVNEDLSIPTHPISPATFFPGPGGVFGDGNDIQPYNNYLQQQTTISRDGTPFWLTPDAKVNGTPVYTYLSDNDSLMITVMVDNVGDVALQPPFYLSAYRDIVDVPRLIVTDSCLVPIRAGEQQAVTISIPHLRSHLSFDRFVIRLNNRGESYPVQTECVYENNLCTFSAAGLLLAHNDRVSTTNGRPVKIGVLANDSITACPSILPGIATTLEGAPPFAPQGIILPVADSILYTPPAGFTGSDTVAYRIACGENISIAHIVVHVAETPDNVTAANCYLPPPASVWSIREAEIPNFDQSLHYMYAHSEILVGDMDGDGVAEIITGSTLTKPVSSTNNAVNFYDGE